MDGEIEAYPKNMRGDASFFESDDENGRISILATIAADFSSRFKVKLENIHMSSDARSALQQWHDYHKCDWLENLQRAWWHGRYDGFSTSNVSSDLQQLRNTYGHSVIKLLTA